MKETIAARVARIVAGSANAIVDSVENAAPEIVMEQAIREVDGVIDDVRAELGRQVAQKHLAGKRLESERARHGELTAQLEVAVKEGRDDLAEAAIAHQLDIEAQLPVLEATLAETEAREGELEAWVTALLGKRRQMQDELADFRKAREMAASPVAAGTPAAGGVDHRVDKAQSAFDRVMERSAGVVGSRADAQTAAQLAELEDITRKNRIQERLADIKSRVRK